MDEHMLRAATKARSALAVLAAVLGEPSPDMAQALAIIEQMLGDIEAGRHPLDRPDDWPQRDRWPDRPHLARWRWAIKTLAVASGTTAHCSPKHEYMRVDTKQARSDALTVALEDIGCLIELASDRNDHARPAGTIDDFFHALDGKLKPKKPVTINVADLIATLQTLPPDLPVMLIVSEGGIDYARAVRVADVARHHRDWSFMPIGQYRELPDENTAGEPFRAVVIDLDTPQ